MKKEELTFKYTTDGRKVVIIGNLNSQEKIVQEVFIVNDIEVPSGENFVVKSLHDAPAISWKEKNLKEIELNYEKSIKDYNKRMDDLSGSLRNTQRLLEDKLKHTGQILKNVSEESFKTIVDYLCGNIKYIVTNGYNPELIIFDEFHLQQCNYSKDKIALITIYGNDDGTLNFGLGRYTDGSGGDRMTYTVHTSLEDALNKFKQVLDSKSLTDETIKKYREYGFEIDPARMKEYKENIKKNCLSNLESYTKQMEFYKQKLTDIENL